MDFAVLNEVCNLLAPFADATARLEAEVVPTSSLVIPVAIRILYKLAKSATQNWSFEQRLGSVKMNPHYVTPTVLDPRFTTKWIQGAAEKARIKLSLTESLDRQQATSYVSRYRHLSAPGYIVSPRRSSLADNSSVEAMLAARCNKDL